MRYRRLVSIVLPAVLAAACTVGPGVAPTSPGAVLTLQPSPSTGAQPPSNSATATTAPSPTITGTPALPSSTPGPSHLTGIARSDAFWGLLANDLIPAYHYDSLAEMASASDLVVLARPVMAREGRASCEPDGSDCTYFVDVEMEIIERLSGRTPDAPLVVDFIWGSTLDGVIDRLNQNLPDERVLMFLRDLDKEARALGLPAEHIEKVEGKYQWTVFEATIRDDGGTALTVPYTNVDYLLAVDGRPFERVVDSVR